MPRIFDNIESSLLPALRETLGLSFRGDFCVGFFNLRGWKHIDSHIENWPGGEDNCCRLLVGMQPNPSEELRQLLGAQQGNKEIDRETSIKLKKRLAEDFRNQLMIGVPTAADETGLRRLSRQLKAKKVVVKLFLRHSLHAKLYLLFRKDPINPIVGYLGSSNLTLAGLSHQGELNIDVLDGDATVKLAKWFDERWNDLWCLDISAELATIIDESWARETPIPPYHIYLKIAYHLSQEARSGITEFRIPKEFSKLFTFQAAAVKIAAHHLNKRGGVLIGDVVGLGKTLMAAALAKIFDDDHNWDTLIVCPKNLESMWQDYVDNYRIHAKVMPITNVQEKLPDLKLYRLVLIDESHNLRNRDGKRFKALQEYIHRNNSKCILLSATPYNKTYLDLANQLRLFIPEETDLGIRPEKYIKRELQGSETEFTKKHQCAVKSIAAFEKSDYPDDWRELMRLYMVRRTRSFIIENYAEIDPVSKRPFLTLETGEKTFFPERIPKTVKFTVLEKSKKDPYGKLYADDVVADINSLTVPRYGLGNYIIPSPHEPPTPSEAKTLENLGRAGKRLMGFCRTNLFKRLESSGHAFLLSIERHVLRNYIFLHAVAHGKPLPIGTQDVGALDSRYSDLDSDLFGDEENNGSDEERVGSLRTVEAFQSKAASLYTEYETRFAKRFKWLRSNLFVDELRVDLQADADRLMRILERVGHWNPAEDEKLNALERLLKEKHSGEKVLVFTQFADTVRYIVQELERRGIESIAGATGDTEDPTSLAWRFSPVSNKKSSKYGTKDELRVLVATDVLSEGQNLQDAYIVVNYDLPWAIIRLVQRAGRVDRIGQKSDKIYCYSFLPADGVEKIIRLRARVRQRLKENAEVVGADESFFEDDQNNQAIRDLFTEKAGILDGEKDDEVDLASQAFQIWNNAVRDRPELEQAIQNLPNVVYSTKKHTPTPDQPEGVLVYMRTAEDVDALSWLDKNGQTVTDSQLTILKAAECEDDEPALDRLSNHHELVAKASEIISKEQRRIGGALGRPGGARFKTYERLKRYAETVAGTIFESHELDKALDDIYNYPLKQSATDTLNRQLKSGISDEELAKLILALKEDGKLCHIEDRDVEGEPQIICSLGLRKG